MGKGTDRFLFQVGLKCNQMNTTVFSQSVQVTKPTPILHLFLAGGGGGSTSKIVVY